MKGYSVDVSVRIYCINRYNNFPVLLLNPDDDDDDDALNKKACA